MVDRWLGRFLDTMEELNLFGNTLLILLSDHGVALGEHGYTGRPPYVLWPEVTDVPFFVRHPSGKMAGERSDYHASTHDVAPTILGALGVEAPDQMTGQDLSVFFAGGTPEQERSHFTWATTNTSGLETKTTSCSPGTTAQRRCSSTSRKIPR